MIKRWMTHNTGQSLSQKVGVVGCAPPQTAGPTDSHIVMREACGENENHAAVSAVVSPPQEPFQRGNRGHRCGLMKGLDQTSRE